MLIAVDGGKDSTKAYAKTSQGDVKEVVFRSRFHNVNQMGSIDKAGNTYEVIYKGEKWLIGDSGTIQDNTTDKINLYNKLSQLTAITQLIEPGVPTEIELVTGFPALQYQNEGKRKKFIDNLRSNGEIITVNNQNYDFTITDIRVRPESSGITAYKNEWFDDKDVIVLDMGGQNSQVTLYEKLVPKVLRTINAGGVHIEEDIRSALGMEGIENITESKVREIIRDKTIIGHPQEEEFKKIVETTIERFILTNIINTLNVNKLSYDLTDVVVIGGNGFNLKDYILKYIPNAKFLDTLKESQMANVRGFYKMVGA